MTKKIQNAEKNKKMEIKNRENQAKNPENINETRTKRKKNFLFDFFDFFCLVLGFFLPFFFQFLVFFKVFLGSKNFY